MDLFYIYLVLHIEHNRDALNFIYLTMGVSPAAGSPKWGWGYAIKSNII